MILLNINWIIDLDGIGWIYLRYFEVSNSVFILGWGKYGSVIKGGDALDKAVHKLMAEVRDNTLMILENNSLADIAF